MQKVWTLGTLAAIVVALAALGVACQGTTEPAAQNPVVEKAATTEPAAHTPVVEKAAAAEKEDEEKEEKAETVKAGTKVELPPAVASAFKKAYPNAVINASAKEEENGKTVYEIESVDKGMNRDLLYSADGTVLECEEQLKETDLPAPVIAALKTRYPKATVTKAERTTKGTLLQYDLALAGAPVAELSLLADGKPAPTTPEKK
jgi:hypothetical protein